MDHVGEFVDEDDIAEGLADGGRGSEHVDDQQDLAGVSVVEPANGGCTENAGAAARRELGPEFRCLEGAAAAVMFVDDDAEAVGGHGGAQVRAVGEHGVDDVAGVVEMLVIDV